jgi:SAM-dependent methyltransferase
MAIYDSIGKQYSTSRIPDFRIVKTLIDLLNLPQGSIIADIGAGTGGYSQLIANQGFSVYAVEPSSVMQNQAIQHPQIQWLTGYAEAIPLPDKSVDGVVSILTIHHFYNLVKAFQEMHRIVKNGAIVLLTFDIRLATKIWLDDYFPFLREDALKFLPLKEITNLIQVNTQRLVETFPLMLPHDLSDLFAAAAWRRPEMYLKPEVRAGISSFAVADQNLVEAGVKKLTEDLNTGKWHEKYGEILSLQELDTGYRFIKAEI